MLVEFAQLVAAAAPAEAMDVSHWSLLDIRSQSAEEIGGVSDEVRKQLSRVLLVRGNGPQHACLGGSAAALSVSGGGGASGGREIRGGVEKMGRNAHASARIPFAPPQNSTTNDSI